MVEIPKRRRENFGKFFFFGGAKLRFSGAFVRFFRKTIGIADINATAID
jgi:hypothetical protein